MKKFLSLLLVMAMVGVIFVGCSDSSGEEGGGSGAADTGTVENEGTDDANAAPDSEEVTLTVWGDTDNQSILEGSFSEINAAFMEKYPNIKLDYQYSGSLDSINVAVQSDSLPDLFWVQGNKSTRMSEMAQNGYILPLGDYNLDSSRFPEESIEYATVDGDTYCSYPAFFDYVCIYYNRDIFDKYSLSEPNNWDEFMDLMQKLQDEGEIPMATGGRGDFDRYWIMQAMAPALFNDTMKSIADGDKDADYTPMAKTFDLYREMVEKGYFGKDFTANDGAGAQLTFTSGNAAMTVDGTWNNGIYKDTGMNIGRFALPGPDGKRYAQSGPSNYETYAISSKTQHPDEAVKYLEFLNSIEAQQILEDKLAAIPLVKDLQVADESAKEMANYDVVGYNVYHVLSGVATESARPQDVFLGECLPKLMMGEIDGEQAVEMIKTEIDKV